MRPNNIVSLPLLAKRTVKIFNPKKSKDSLESFDRMCDKHKRRTPEIVLNDLNEYAICIYVRIFFIYRNRQKWIYASIYIYIYDLLGGLQRRQVTSSSQK